MNVLKIIIVITSYSLLFYKPDPNVFFKGLVIFMAGLLYDYNALIYAEYASRRTLHKYIGYIGTTLSSILTLVGIGGLCQIIKLRSNDLTAQAWTIETSTEFVPFSFSFNIRILSWIILVLLVLAWIENTNRCKNCIYKVNLTNNMPAEQKSFLGS